MKRNGYTPAILFLFGALIGLSALSSLWMAATSHAQDKAAAVTDGPAVVEEKMHDLMENIFQPTYRRLKAALESEPKDRAAWRSARSDILILAEGSNLLFHRLPEKDVAAWKQFAAGAREEGKKAYIASKASKYDETKQHYTAMLVQCNKCHTQFADGKHQLTP